MSISSSYGKQLLDKLMKTKLPRLYGLNDKSFAGCNEYDLQALKNNQGVPYLPKIYVEFMLVFGNKAFPLYPNDVYFTPGGLTDIKESAIEIMKEDSPFLTLPPNAFVFEYYTIPRFSFFIVSEQDDPDVMFYDFRFSNSFQTIAPSLSSYYDSMIHIALNYPQ